MTAGQTDGRSAGPPPTLGSSLAGGVGAGRTSEMRVASGGVGVDRAVGGASAAMGVGARVGCVLVAVGVGVLVALTTRVRVAVDVGGRGV